MCFGTSSGRVSQLCHFGPIIAIFLILFITCMGFYCLLEWWPPIELSSQLHLLIYVFWPFVILYNYFNAVFIGPGFVPNGWRPDSKNDETKLQFCDSCNSFKAPRSHHCKKCNRCVMKMDHHCPWINTCCGHFNHASFVYFLFFVPLGCSHAIVVLGASIYRTIFRNYYIFYGIENVPIVNLGMYQLIASMFAIGMAFGVAIAVGFLFIVQVKSIVKNQTAIESWIIKKAIHRREHFKMNEHFVYPYDLGLKENIRQVFNWSGDFRPIGNGVWWIIARNCDQFTLTVEQIAQKEDKRTHAIRYLGTKLYKGSIFPITYGLKTTCCLPWSEEPRMPVENGDIILVTRWQKYWLYGENIKLNVETRLQKKTSKGWFPTECVKIYETKNDNQYNSAENFNERDKFKDTITKKKN